MASHELECQMSKYMEHTRHILGHMTRLRQTIQQDFHNSTCADDVSAYIDMMKSTYDAHHELWKAHAILMCGEYSPSYQRLWNDTYAIGNFAMPV